MSSPKTASAMQLLLVAFLVTSAIATEIHGPPGVTPSKSEFESEDIQEELIVTKMPQKRIVIKNLSKSSSKTGKVAAIQGDLMTGNGFPSQKHFGAFATTFVELNDDSIENSKKNMNSEETLTPLEEQRLLKKLGVTSLKALTFGVKTREAPNESSAIHNLDGLNPDLPAFAFSEDDMKSVEELSAPERKPSKTTSEKVEDEREKSTQNVVQTPRQEQEAANDFVKEGGKAIKISRKDELTKALKHYKENGSFQVGKNLVPVHLFFDKTIKSMRRSRPLRTKFETSTPSSPTGTSMASIRSPLPAQNTFSSTPVTKYGTDKSLTIRKIHESWSVAPEKDLRMDDFLIATTRPPLMVEEESALDNFTFPEVPSTSAVHQKQKLMNPTHMVLPDLLSMPSPVVLRAFPSLNTAVHPVGFSQSLENVGVPKVGVISATTTKTRGSGRSASQRRHKKKIFRKSIPVSAPSLQIQNSKSNQSALIQEPTSIVIKSLRDIKQFSVRTTTQGPTALHYASQMNAQTTGINATKDKIRRPFALGQAIQRTAEQSTTSLPLPKPKIKIVRTNDVSNVEESFARSLLTTEKMLIEGLKKMKLAKRHHTKKSNSRQAQALSAGRTVIDRDRSINELRSSRNNHDGFVDMPTASEPRDVELELAVDKSFLVVGRDSDPNTADKNE